MARRDLVPEYSHSSPDPYAADIVVQDPQPDGDHNPEPVKVTLRGACEAEAISRKPWTSGTYISMLSRVIILCIRCSLRACVVHTGLNSTFIILERH